MKYQIVSFFIIAFFAVFSNAEIYRWVDEHGKTRFSDKKRQDIVQETLKLKVNPSTWSRFNISVESLQVELSESEKRDIEKDVNNIYEFYDRVLFFDFYKSVPVKILILKDLDAYISYLSKKLGRRPPSSYGLYLPKDNQIVVYIQKDRQRTFKTIKHEVSHAIVDSITPYAPSWINEGLAEQMETLSKQGEHITISLHYGNNRAVKRAYASDSLHSIEDFLKLPSKKWRHKLNNGNSILQSQAGQFIYYLLSTSPNRNFIVRLMHNFERGDRTISYYLVNDNYIGGIKTLIVAWNNWLATEAPKQLVL